MTETVFEAVNADTDKLEARKKAKNKQLGHEEGEWGLRYPPSIHPTPLPASQPPGLTLPLSAAAGAEYAMGKDCIMHGYMAKLGNPFLTQWQRRYFYLFPNRLEWRGEGESPVRRWRRDWGGGAVGPARCSRGTRRELGGAWGEEAAGLSLSPQQSLLTMEEIDSVEETQVKERKCILLRIRGGKQFVLQCDVSAAPARGAGQGPSPARRSLAPCCPSLAISPGCGSLPLGTRQTLLAAPSPLYLTLQASMGHKY